MWSLIQRRILKYAHKKISQFDQIFNNYGYKCQTIVYKPFILFHCQNQWFFHSQMADYKAWSHSVKPIFHLVLPVLVLPKYFQCLMWIQLFYNVGTTLDFKTLHVIYIDAFGQSAISVKPIFHLATLFARHEAKTNIRNTIVCSREQIR